MFDLNFLSLILKGSSKSGNFGHAGIPDQVGGSQPSSSPFGSSIAKLKNYIEDYQKEGNEKFASELQDILSNLEKGNLDKVIELFQSSNVKYDIPTTYNNVVREIQESQVDLESGKDWGVKPGEYKAWRSGNLDSKRGIFFAVDKKGAEAYSGIHKTPAKQYIVTVKKPLVAKRLEDAYAELTGIKKEDILRERDSSDNVNDWWRDLDKKIFKLAKKQGYDSITYTHPAPPAVKEMIVFDKNSIREL